MLHLLLAAAAAATASPSPAPSFFSPVGNFFGAIFGWIPVLIANLIAFITLGTHSLALSLIIVAALITALFWFLNVAQFKSMLAMQKIAPKIKALQARYKSDPQKLQQATMELYRSEGVNPLAGCLPTLVQLPVLFSVWYAVGFHRDLYDHASFLWIGSALAQNSPVVFGLKLFAPSLAQADLLLIVIYMISQYLSMRFTTMPATDPAQAQQLKMMQVISPLMIGFIGLRANWPSAMVLYWLAYNVFRMGQQFYLLRKYHEPLSFIDSEHVITEDVPAAVAAPPQPKPSGNGSSKRKKKKGAKS
ncbi:MAG TPA: YidC/Oxa1 family membrane protein insertase [Candidatus Aquilonibacter sp.]